MGPAEEAPQEKKKRKSRPPLLAVTLVRKVMDVSSISVEELCRRIHAGVLINDNKLKFWVDLDSGKNCFLLLAKSIHGIYENGGKWGWIDGKEKCYEGEVYVPVAGVVVGECSLKLSATFKTIMLSPKTTYEVAFVVKDGNHSRGYQNRTELSLTLPDGTMLGPTEFLKKKPEGGWIDMLVGTFVTTPMNVGEITINYTYFGVGMDGLIVKGIVFRPKD